MEDAIRQNLIRLGVKRGDKLGVAVSGGVDSMALLHCVCALRKSMGITVAAYHFEHGIRGQASRDDMAFVKAQCDRRGVQCIADSADVPAIAQSTGQSVEAAARRVRYAFLDKQDAVFIATAHHMDDMAETVLLNLVRGAGLPGLCGIPEKRGRYIRPMLGMCRQQIEDYAQRNDIAYVCDETNDDTSYARNYIRHEILPRLAEINGGVCANMARTAALLREDEDALAQLAADAGGIAVREDGVYIDRAVLAAQPAAVAGRMVRLAISQTYNLTDIENVHIQSVLGLAANAQSGKRIDIGGGLAAAVVYHELMIGKTRPVGYNNTLVPFSGEGQYRVFGTVFTCRAVSGAPEFGGRGRCASPGEPEYFDAQALRGTQFRRRCEGDTITPLGMRGRKRLSDYLSDRKVPLHVRDSLILLANGSDVFWVVGVGVSEKSKAGEGRDILKITYGEKGNA